VLLAAFAGELRRIPDLVTEPMIGAIRFQWWRDALEAAAAASEGTDQTGNPLADGLVATIRRHELPWGLVHGMIDAEETALDATAFHDSGETRQHLVKSEAALFELSGLVAGARAPRAVWTEAGIAYGAFRRALAYEERRRRGAQTFLARDNPEGDVEGAGRRWFEAQARDALDVLRTKRPEMDAATRRILLPLAIIEPSFARSSRPGVSPASAAGGLSALARASRLLWAHWRGGF
jgi:phytoene synthase